MTEGKEPMKSSISKKSANQKVQEMIDRLNETDIAYLSVDFPISHVGEGVFRSLNGVEFGFTESGAGYVSERNPRYAYATFTRLVRQERWEELAKMANEAIIPMKGAGRGLIMASYNGKVVGILRHYNAISHSELIETLLDKGLDKDVFNWRMNHQFLLLDMLTFTVESATKGQIKIGLRVINGHSGHHALSFQILIRAEAYEFSSPIYGRSRHMTGVTETFNSLKGAVKEISELQLDAKLLAMDPASMIAMIHHHTKGMSTRQESLMQLVESAECDNALDVIIILGQYASTRGYGQAVSGLLDPVINHLLTK